MDKVVGIAQKRAPLRLCRQARSPEGNERSTGGAHRADDRGEIRHQAVSLKRQQ